MNGYTSGLAAHIQGAVDLVAGGEHDACLRFDGRALRTTGMPTSLPKETDIP